MEGNGVGAVSFGWGREGGGAGDMTGHGLGSLRRKVAVGWGGLVGVEGVRVGVGWRLFGGWGGGRTGIGMASEKGRRRVSGGVVFVVAGLE